FRELVKLIGQNRADQYSYVVRTARTDLKARRTTTTFRTVNGESDEITPGDLITSQTGDEITIVNDVGVDSEGSVWLAKEDMLRVGRGDRPVLKMRSYRAVNPLLWGRNRWWANRVTDHMHGNVDSWDFIDGRGRKWESWAPVAPGTANTN